MAKETLGQQIFILLVLFIVAMAIWGEQIIEFTKWFLITILIAGIIALIIIGLVWYHDRQQEGHY